MTGGGPGLRVLVHALDRTGPPMLAIALLQATSVLAPDVPMEVLAFRGGPLEAEASQFGAVDVVLEHHEPWDVQQPDDQRFNELRHRFSTLGPAGANVLVSVSAAQTLPLLPTGIGPVATWAVEVAEDLHWLDDPVQVRERTDRWLAGSEATRAELLERLGPSTSVSVVPEFIADPPPVGDGERRTARRHLGADPGEVVVVGAGIGTWRKGLDLFVEAATLAAARHGDGLRFVWVGGEADPLPDLLAPHLADGRVGPAQLVPSVADFDALLAGADIFLHTARADAFPLVCVHAAAAGVPVVSFSGVGGISEMLGGSMLGAPFPAVDDLVDHLGRLLDPAVRAAAGARQRSAAAPHLASNAAPRLLRELRSMARGDR